MSDQSQERAPDGSEESAAARVGEPERDSAERRAREEERPDLDERERRLRTERKPMGPPLEEPEEREERRGPGESTEAPTDPEQP